MRKCKVLINGVMAGTLTEVSPKRYTFLYAPLYLTSGNATAICLQMPLSETPYESDSLFPFFSNMLPEGMNRAFLSRLYHLSPDDDFGLLLKCAAGDTIGAISIKDPEYEAVL
ncbi:MAG: HipA N-terminal domain-containing protein [Bacteroidales bacterium]|nr:HipA N-terminal domain-containing protein [Bacteroidales bacterium]